LLSLLLLGVSIPSINMDSDSDTHSPSKVPISKSVFLNHPKDWNQWFFHLKDAGKGNKVWQYIDPLLEVQPVELVEPVEPEL
jgi:hypothetical protein